MKHFLYLKVIILALILSFTACGGSGSSRGGDSFIPVMDITGVNTVATACTHLALSGNVEPSDATNQTIIWSNNQQARPARQ